MMSAAVPKRMVETRDRILVSAFLSITHGHPRICHFMDLSSPHYCSLPNLAPPNARF